jgi:hypothetical protein
VRSGGGTLILLLAVSGDLAGQARLDDAAQHARQAWLAHDPATLLQGSPGVILQIPGADPSAAMGRGQAAELLSRYLLTAAELGVDIAVAREVEEGRGYVELVRRYKISGTAEERRETVFLGLRRVGERWVVVELRADP